MLNWILKKMGAGTLIGFMWSNIGFSRAFYKSSAIRTTVRRGIVRLWNGLSLLPQEDSWYSFLLEAEYTHGHNAAERIREIEKLNVLFGIGIRDLSACSIMPQPTTLPRAPAPFVNKTTYIAGRAHAFWNKLLLCGLRSQAVWHFLR
jgi:hypothetical protein